MTCQRLVRCLPEEAGVSSEGIQKTIQALGRVNYVHGVMILRHGMVIAENWWYPYQPQFPHQLFSLSKSFTSTAIGFAIQEGLLALDDPLTAFFADKMPTPLPEKMDRMTVRHLLTMSCGHGSCPAATALNNGSRDWQRDFFREPIVFEPGKHFVYNSLGTYMLSALITRLTGLSTMEYLRPRLFAPLGMGRVTSEGCPLGISTGGWGMNLRTEDIARFGQFYLQKGVWNGVRLLSEEWIEQATAKQIDTAHHGVMDWGEGYGFQFWRCQPGCYRGDGAFGQYCIVLDDKDMVVAVNSGVDDMQRVLTAIWDNLLPACSPEPTIPAAPHAFHDLQECLAHANLPWRRQPTLQQGLPEGTYRYRLEVNALGFESVEFAVTGAGCLMTLASKDGIKRNMFSGNNLWKWNEGGIYEETVDYGHCACRMGWVAPNDLELQTCYVNTPVVVNASCRFDAAGQGTVSLAFEPHCEFWRGKTFPRELVGSK